MTGKPKVSAQRSPFKILAVFTLAFTFQAMSLVVFQGDRHSPREKQPGRQSASMGIAIAPTETFSVTSMEDSGPGSLRQAILDANESPGLDEIRFVFAEPITITLESFLEITDPVSMEGHGDWFTDTVPGWLTIDGKNVYGDVFMVMDAPGSSFRRIRLVNADQGFGFVVMGKSDGSEFISNTVQSGMGGIKFENTGHVTVTHNALVDLADAAVQATNSSRLWLLRNHIRAGDTGIRLMDGVSDVLVISNTLIGGLARESVGVMAAGTPAPTGVIIRGNLFTDTVPVRFGPGTNNGFPAPEILDAHTPITATKSLDFSARSPADPFSYTYPLTMDVYRVRAGAYLPLGVGVSYGASHYPDVVKYTVHFTDPVGLSQGDQLALIATTANPSSSEFSPPVALTPRPPPDDDGDGVEDADDQCPGTVIPETTIPSVTLRVNRFALVDGDFSFDTTSPKGEGPDRSYTTTETAGCSCEQIVDQLGLGEGHVRFGCSISAMDDWVTGVSAVDKRGDSADEERSATTPHSFILEQNYPNPFNPSTKINFHVPVQQHVTLRVYDMLGRVVTTIVNKELEPGFYQVPWDARNVQGHAVTSGLYLYRLEAGDFSTERMMSLLR